MSPERPAPESPCSAEPQSLPGVPQAQGVPGAPSPRVFLEPNPRVSLSREGGDVRSKIILISLHTFMTNIRTIMIMQGFGWILKSGKGFGVFMRFSFACRTYGSCWASRALAFAGPYMQGL